MKFVGDDDEAAAIIKAMKADEKPSAELCLDDGCGGLPPAPPVRTSLQLIALGVDHRTALRVEARQGNTTLTGADFRYGPARDLKHACQTCAFFCPDNSKCHLYEALKLDPAVSSEAWCEAWQDTAQKLEVAMSAQFYRDLSIELAKPG